MAKATGVKYAKGDKLLRGIPAEREEIIEIAC